MMTAKEYLSRAYRLNERINSYLAELDDLRALACSISSPSFEEKYGGTRPTDPPFVRAIEKIDCLEREISLEIEKLISVKKEINEAIRSVPDNREQASCDTATSTTIPGRKSASLWIRANAPQDGCTAPHSLTSKFPKNNKKIFRFDRLCPGLSGDYMV